MGRLVVRTSFFILSRFEPGGNIPGDRTKIGEKWKYVSPDTGSAVSYPAPFYLCPNKLKYLCNVSTSRPRAVPHPEHYFPGTDRAGFYCAGTESAEKTGNARRAAGNGTAGRRTIGKQLFFRHELRVKSAGIELHVPDFQFPLRVEFIGKNKRQHHPVAGGRVALYRAGIGTLVNTANANHISFGKQLHHFVFLRRGRPFSGPASIL